MKMRVKNAFAIVCGTTGAVIIAGAMVLAVSRPATATAKFAQQTGKPCAQCHQNPTGGTELTPFGEKFKANGNELPK